MQVRAAILQFFTFSIYKNQFHPMTNFDQPSRESDEISYYPHIDVGIECRRIVVMQNLYENDEVLASYALTDPVHQHSNEEGAAADHEDEDQDSNCLFSNKVHFYHILTCR